MDYFSIHSSLKRTGTYMATWNLLDDASWCVPCPTGCSCTRKTDQSDKTAFNLGKYSTLAPLPGYYLASGAEKCTKCTDSLKYCKTCSSSTTCTACY